MKGSTKRGIDQKPIGFGVSESRFYPYKIGKMICHSTGEIVKADKLKKRAVGTWVKFTPTE